MKRIAFLVVTLAVGTLVALPGAFSASVTTCGFDYDDPSPPTLTGVIKGNVVIVPYKVCIISEAKISGDLILGTESTVYANEVEIGDDVKMPDGGALSISDSVVHGDLRSESGTIVNFYDSSAKTIDTGKTFVVNLNEITTRTVKIDNAYQANLRDSKVETAKFKHVFLLEIVRNTYERKLDCSDNVTVTAHDNVGSGKDNCS